MIQHFKLIESKILNLYLDSFVKLKKVDSDFN